VDKSADKKSGNNMFSIPIPVKDDKSQKVVEGEGDDTPRIIAPPESEKKAKTEDDKK